MKKSVYLSALLLTGAAFQASAVPAIRTPFTVQQPDGTTVTVTLSGDERAHMMRTADGFPIVWDDARGYVFASIQPDGSLQPTTLRAADPSARNAETVSFLNEITPARLEAAGEMMARRAALSTQSRPMRAAAASRSSRHRGPGLSLTTFPSTGSPRSLIILAEYQDVRFDDKNSSANKYANYTEGGAHEYFTQWLMTTGFNAFGATGSANEWFVDNSTGTDGTPLFNPQFDLYGPVTLSENMAYYGGNDSYDDDRRPAEMIIEACRLLDDEIDFSMYDVDGDGIVDNIFVVYAGCGEADGGGRNTIWPHSWDILSAGKEEISLDGVLLNHYACTNETNNALRRPAGIGTFVHEFSHVLGLPDLYATSENSKAYTPQDFSVLDQGPYNNEGRTPPNYSAYELYALGWIEPEQFPVDGDVTIPALADSKTAYIVYTEQEREYFLVENRQLKRWDAYLPGHGMLIWHIDWDKKIFDDNVVNNDQRHQYVDLVEANNLKAFRYAAGHPFPGTDGITEYEFYDWLNKKPGVTLTSIAETGSDITLHAVNTAWRDPNVGVEEISSDGSLTDVAAPVYYNLQGQRVSNPRPGDFLIRQTGAKAEKIRF